ncbi:MAG: hypothetical protein MJ252_10465 [archaeon]|nr:hypothetical protein [archaeon]
MSFKSNPWNFFIKFTFFSKSNEIFFNGNLKYQSKFGFLMSIVVLLALFFFIIIFSYYEEYNLQIITESKQNELIDLSNIPIFIKILPKKGEIIFPSNETYDLKVHMMHQIDMVDQPNEFRLTYLKTQLCSTIEREENPLLYKFFGRYNLSQFICISPGQNIKLEGYYQDRSYDYTALRISFGRCSEGNCAEGFPETYEGAQFMVFYLSTEIIHSNEPKQILQYKPKNTLLTICSKYYKRRSIYFSKGQYRVRKHSQKEILKEDFFYESSNSFLTIDEVGNGDIINNDNILASFDFGFSGEITTYQKYYTHIMTIFSYIGGWLYFILILAKIIDFIITEKLYTFSLIEKIISTDKYLYKAYPKLIYIENPYCHIGTFEENGIKENNSKELKNYKINSREDLKQNSKKNKEDIVLNSREDLHNYTENNSFPFRNLPSQMDKNNNNSMLPNINISISKIPIKKQNTKLKELSLNRKLLSFKNLLTPFSFMKIRNQNYSLVIFNLLLSEFLSLESLFYLNKVTKRKMYIEEGNGLKMILRNENNLEGIANSNLILDKSNNCIQSNNILIKKNINES